MILSVLYKAEPREVRLIMVTRRCSNSPRTRDSPPARTVVTDMRQAANALSWCMGEVEGATG